MTRMRRTIPAILLALLVAPFTGIAALGRDTESELLVQIAREQNPVRKAKSEIKLAHLRLEQLRDDYSQNHYDAGVKLLGTFVDGLKDAWNLLQNSGRKASKQPGGFRELEIALREDGRALQDLQQEVSYFDRAPLANAARELDQIHNQVLTALFPSAAPKKHKGSAPPPAPKGPGNPQDGQ